MQQGPVLSLSINKHKASAEFGSELELVDLWSLSRFPLQCL